jgi:hypothetical protein
MAPLTGNQATTLEDLACVQLWIVVLVAFWLLFFTRRSLHCASFRLQIVILQFYGFDMEPPKAALRQKGFVVKQLIRPALAALEAELATASQLWIISGGSASQVSWCFAG